MSAHRRLGPQLMRVTEMSAAGDVSGATETLLRAVKVRRGVSKRRMLTALWALSAVVRLQVPALPGDGFWGLQIARVDGGDPAQAPAHVWLMGRWLTAVANDDIEQAVALYQAADDETLGRFVPHLVKVVGDIARQAADLPGGCR